MIRSLTKIETYLLYIVVFLLPLLALPISPNPYVVSKLALLVYGLGIILLVRVVNIIISGKLDIRLSKYDVPVFIIGASYIASAIMVTPNKMEAFLLPGSATAVAGAVLLYYLINQQDDHAKQGVVRALAYSAGLVSLTTIFSAIGLFEQIPQLPDYIRSGNFTPLGGYLPTAILLVSIIPVTLEVLMSEKDIKHKIILGISTALIVFGLGLSAFNIFPGRPFAPNLPSMSTSWVVAVDSLKDNPVLGAGAGNYLTGFNRFRPIEFNQTNLWAIKFSTASNFYFTGMTEAGLLFVAGLILLSVVVYRNIKTDLKENRIVSWGFRGNLRILSLILLAVLIAVFPATIEVIVLLFILLALYAKTHKSTLNLSAASVVPVTHFSAENTQNAVASRFPAILVTAPVVIAIVLLFIRSTSVLSAEYTFKRALDAFIQNEAVLTYETMQNAINRNPFVDRYRLSYSQVNIAIANSIASQEEITDQDRATIAQLIQQSIDEAKAAVILNPLRSGNWLNLANIYRAIIPLAEGADVFAVQSLSQAIALDPINPSLRIAMGGIYYAAGDFNRAANLFELAASAKPDFANARYNLAFAYRNLGQIDAAINEMTVVMSLVDRDSPDYEIARQALDELQTERAELTAAQGDELTPPDVAQEPVLEPPLDLPEGSEPPEAPLAPVVPESDENDEE